LNILKVIPVIDVLNGKAVHAVKGKRKKYKPLESVISSSYDPKDVAKAFDNIGFRELYIADLDAITKGQLNFSLLKNIANETSLKIMVDAGITELKMAERIFDAGVHKIIIGTETLLNIGFVAEAIDAFGSKNVVVSIDLMGRKIIGRIKLDKIREPLDLIFEFQNMGVSQIIILDLAKVGSAGGLNLSFLQGIFENVEARVLVGGGVRDLGDLKRLRDLRVFGVLVASALHSGKILPAELRYANLI
jgi:phosphoribosylformimino-5-aminoimidazole carboxamide ribotide isomerase